ncbi:hypothetical protein TRAPUB_8188 [Trametes pubescens]|uniref:Uncharacterized protein n=1 Tax=Trametes pubescens TaxID=154538 RepID=A0A1M2W628_TRAPU|nr:hypothetical protein TRAPUB_8188 [Trametes pubescens]
MPRVIIEAAGRAEAFGRTAGILNGHGSHCDKPQQHARGLGGREGGGRVAAGTCVTIAATQTSS